jgi:hypothetical protein
MGKVIMKKSSRQLSNPYSTGGGGVHFEAYVQAAFVVLMLTGGFAPCMPCWPIKKIKLQGKYAGYDTDDMVIFIEHPSNGQTCKILGQIKHTIRITENDKVFADVIQSAWKDFNNASLFSKGKDTIALITGPLSATDINDVRTILEWARNSETDDEFIKKVELTYFSSHDKQNKLKAFKTCIEKANDSNAISDELLFEFLKHFHLLGYDLDIKAGVTLSLLHSLVGQFSTENAQSLWSRLVEEVQFANKNAGTISLKSLPEDLQNVFRQRVNQIIPSEFSSTQLPTIKSTWSQHPYASELMIANLLGAWDEKNISDANIVCQLANQEFDSWILKIRDIQHQSESPVVLRNGKWRVRDRKDFWHALGTRVYDNNLDSFKQWAVIVLSERDPKFELPTGERIIARIHGKVLNHSQDLRKGIAESLALLGNIPNELSNCSQNKP